MRLERLPAHPNFKDTIAGKHESPPSQRCWCPCQCTHAGHEMKKASSLSTSLVTPLGSSTTPTLGSSVPRSAKSWSSSDDETEPDALGDGVTIGAWYW